VGVATSNDFFRIFTPYAENWNNFVSNDVHFLVILTGFSIPVFRNKSNFEIILFPAGNGGILVICKIDP